MSDVPPDADASAALSAATARFGRLLRAVAHRYRLTPDDADELVQDVRLRLWRALGSGEKIRAATSSYVYRAVTTAALDLVRARRARRGVSLDLVGEDADRPAAASGRPPGDPARDLADRELGGQIARALGGVAPDRRLAVRMHLLGYAREEIASLLGWSEARTRNLLYRGLDDLRRRLTAMGVGPTGPERR